MQTLNAGLEIDYVTELSRQGAKPCVVTNFKFKSNGIFKVRNNDRERASKSMGN